ncbi:DUF4177 domain-containing protein [Tropicimonas sp. IMCC34043]|uniref:DUF4177 domain-containing protein n=1 Tax=Tropicimonas sp. IMCC34043 TaxID=2248760 RepID=UPI000E273074|nr:DUF4177 domain-containing protein [Tropicimonas sp. IMCC34043]
MPVYEYKVVPAPEKGIKAKGLKGTKERFAAALEAAMNELGLLGWDYVRADVLPCEERTGLTGTATSYVNMLVFRRVLADQEASGTFTPVRAAVETPAAVAPAPQAMAAPVAPVRMPSDTGPVPHVDAPTRTAPAAVASFPPLHAPQPPKETTEAAAAAAAAALSAYRGTKPGPKLDGSDDPETR